MIIMSLSVPKTTPITMSSSNSHPLFSTIVTLYTLILLYLPTHFAAIAFSPVLILTVALLLSLLRLGSANDQTTTLPPEERGEGENDDPDHGLSEPDSDNPIRSAPPPSPDHGDGSFARWNLRAPLEVIYEAEDEENESEGCCSRSLSRYFPESESDISSDDDDGDFSGVLWDSACEEYVKFKWEEEEEEEEEDERDELGLIEIDLDRNCNDYDSNIGSKKRESLEFHVDEDSFIEIDISSQVRSCLNVT